MSPGQLYQDAKTICKPLHMNEHYNDHRILPIAKGLLEFWEKFLEKNDGIS